MVNLVFFKFNLMFFLCYFIKCIMLVNIEFFIEFIDNLVIDKELVVEWSLKFGAKHIIFL